MDECFSFEHVSLGLQLRWHGVKHHKLCGSGNAARANPLTAVGLKWLKFQFCLNFAFRERRVGIAAAVGRGEGKITCFRISL